MEFLSDCFSHPVDKGRIIAWAKLSTKSQNTLKRAIEKSDWLGPLYKSGFSFELLSKISLENLNDARSIGPARVEELIQELISLSNEIENEGDLELTSNALSQLMAKSSPLMLEKLTVEENLEKYFERVESFEIPNYNQRRGLQQDFIKGKRPFQEMMFGGPGDFALGHLIDGYLQYSLALASHICEDRDMRVRIVAGNLGLLVGITSFPNQPNRNFVEHIRKNIRGSVQNLVGSLNLSYEDIVKIMFGTTKHETRVLENYAGTREITPFANCKTFSELFEVLDRELLKLPQFTERSLAMLKIRHQAFEEPELTLEKIGEEWDLTRERVRQIVDPLMEIRIKTEPEIGILVQAVELFARSEDENQFKKIVAENEIFDGEEMTWQRLWAITRILSPDVLAIRVHEKHKELEEGAKADSTIKVSIKKDRSKFGLYDLQVVAKNYEIDEARAYKIISEIYPRSVRCGSLVLARTKHLDSMFENSIAKQLKVSTPLEIKELLKGLQRSGEQRTVSLTGSLHDLTDLIHELAGNPPSQAKFLSGLIKEIEFSTFETWFLEIFSEANFGILHRNDVVNFAMRNASLNLSSVSVYLANSPIVRAHGRALYSLVGTQVTEDQLDDYYQIIRGVAGASEISYEMIDASKGLLSVKPNLTSLSSGVLFPPAGHRKIFDEFEFLTSCSCGKLDTTQAVKFTSGFWTGFTAMFRHGFAQHHMNKESTFLFEFNFDKSIVILLVS